MEQGVHLAQDGHGTRLQFEQFVKEGRGVRQVPKVLATQPGRGQQDPDSGVGPERRGLLGAPSPTPGRRPRARPLTAAGQPFQHLDEGPDDPGLPAHLHRAVQEPLVVRQGPQRARGGLVRPIQRPPGLFQAGHVRVRHRPVPRSPRQPRLRVEHRDEPVRLGPLLAEHGLHDGQQGARARVVFGGPGVQDHGLGGEPRVRVVRVLHQAPAQAVRGPDGVFQTVPADRRDLKQEVRALSGVGRGLLLALQDADQVAEPPGIRQDVLEEGRGLGVVRPRVQHPFERLDGLVRLARLAGHTRLLDEDRPSRRPVRERPGQAVVGHQERPRVAEPPVQTDHLAQQGLVLLLEREGLLVGADREVRPVQGRLGVQAPQAEAERRLPPRVGEGHGERPLPLGQDPDPAADHERGLGVPPRGLGEFQEPVHRDVRRGQGHGRRHGVERRPRVPLDPTRDVRDLHVEGGPGLRAHGVVGPRPQQVLKVREALAGAEVRCEDVRRGVPRPAGIEEGPQLHHGLFRLVRDEGGLKEPERLVVVVQRFPAQAGEVALEPRPLARGFGARDLHPDHVGQFQVAIRALVGPVQAPQDLAVLRVRLEDLHVAVRGRRVVADQVLVQPSQAHADVAGLLRVRGHVNPAAQDLLEPRVVLELQGDVLEQPQGRQVARVEVEDLLEHGARVVVEEQPALIDLPQFQEESEPPSGLHGRLARLPQQGGVFLPQRPVRRRVPGRLHQGIRVLPGRQGQPHRLRDGRERLLGAAQALEVAVQPLPRPHPLGGVLDGRRHVLEQGHRTLDVPLGLVQVEEPPARVHERMVQGPRRLEIPHGPRRLAQVLLARAGHGQVQDHASLGVLLARVALGQEGHEGPHVPAPAEHRPQRLDVLPLEVQLFEPPDREVVARVLGKDALVHLPRTLEVAEAVQEDLPEPMPQFGPPLPGHRTRDLLAEEAGVVRPLLEPRVQDVQVLPRLPGVLIQLIQFFV